MDIEYQIKGISSSIEKYDKNGSRFSNLMKKLYVDFQPLILILSFVDEVLLFMIIVPNLLSKAPGACPSSTLGNSYIILEKVILRW